MNVDDVENPVDGAGVGTPGHETGDESSGKRNCTHCGRQTKNHQGPYVSKCQLDKLEANNSAADKK